MLNRLLHFGSVLIALIGLCGTVAHAQIISTIAGNGTAGYSGDGGTATNAELNHPADVTVDAAGNLYIADQVGHRIREVAAGTGIITTVAGNGVAGYSGDGGPATSAELNNPIGVEIDTSGNLYIADYSNNRIRRVAARTGIITTVAGNGTAGYSGDGGAATSAELNYPRAAAVDTFGNLYIADYINNRIRKVAAGTGIISTVAGNGAAGYSGDGGAATSAELNDPIDVTIDTAGNLYIADYLNLCVREVAAGSGIISTFAGNGTSGYSGDGGAATSAQLYQPIGVVMDTAGNLYISEFGYSSIRKVATVTGIITTVAGLPGNPGYSGDGGAATKAKLYNPAGVAVDTAGNQYIADTVNNRIRLIVQSIPTTTTLTTSNSSLYNGASVTFTAVVAPTTGTTKPTGTVEFFSDGTSIGTGSLDSTGTATLTNSSLAIGTHSITATYTQNLPYLTSTASISQTITTIPTGITPTMASYAASGSSVPMSWTVSASNGQTPIGSVTVVADGSTTLCNAITLSGGAGACSESTLSSATHSIQFEYNGSTQFATASDTVPLTIGSGLAATVTQISSSLNPSAYGHPVTLTSLINTGGAKPTGTVTFENGGSSIGTGTVSTVSTTNLVPNSQTFAGWTVGYYVVAAPVIAPVADQGPIGTSGSVESIAFPASTNGYSEFTYSYPSELAGETITYSVWLKATSPSVIFIGGGGDQTTYNFGATCYVTTTWQRCSVTGSVPSSDSETFYFMIRSWGQSNAIALDAWGPQLEIASTAGPYVATSGTSATGFGGMATLITSSLPLGTDSITAAYGGDSSDAGSTSAALSQVVNQAATLTQVSSSLNPSPYGQPVTLTSLINTGGAKPTGTVTFESGGSSIGTTTVSSVSTTNLLSHSNNASAWHTDYPATSTIKALTMTDPFGGSITQEIDFSGQGNSDATNVLVVAGPFASQTFTGSIWLRAPTATTTSLGLNQVSGQWVGAYNTIIVGTQWQRFSVTLVIPSTEAAYPNLSLSLGNGSGGPSAIFYSFGAQVEASSTVGPYVATTGAPASGYGGVATLTTSSLPAGSDSITAVYSGDTNNQTSTSFALTQTVSQTTPTLTWATPASITYGTALSPAQLNATVVGGIAGSLVYTPAAGTILGAGVQTLSVTFTPTDAADYSPVTQTVSLTVNAAALTITPTSVSKLYGTVLSLSAFTASGLQNGDTVTSATFTSLGTAALATPGTYPITATAAVGTGLSNYAITYATGSTLTVTKAPVVITSASSLNPSAYGNSVTLTFTLTGNGAIPTGTATVSDGGTALGTVTLNGSGQATYSVAVWVAGTHNISVVYGGDANYQ